MNVFSSLGDEVRFLADSMFDGNIDAARMQRLESLIVNDVSCLQAYLERMNFHREMIEDCESRTPEQAAVAVLKEFTQAVRVQEQRRKRSQYGIYAAMALSLFVVVSGTLHLSGAFTPAPIGTISSMSADVQSTAGGIDLGQIVHQNETISIRSGLAGLQLPNVRLDIVGPATITLQGPGRLSLTSGQLIARVLPGGEGFTVTTPDAEVVDLGTEFQVEYQPARGTMVSVRQGRAQASLLDRRGDPTKVLQLTDNRSAIFLNATGTAREVEFQPQAFAPVDRSRGGIQAIDGTLRTLAQAPASLQSNGVNTSNYLLVIPEQASVVLTQDLTVKGLQGPTRIPAGTTVSSFLLHYDPTTTATIAPRGAVTFSNDVLTVLTDSQELLATDVLLGLPTTRYDSAKSRGLELEEDQIRISADRKSVSVSLDVDPESLDEARILVIASPQPESSIPQ